MQKYSVKVKGKASLHVSLLETVTRDLLFKILYKELRIVFGSASVPDKLKDVKDIEVDGFSERAIPIREKSTLLYLQQVRAECFH